ncbi:hypothetical protein DCAR_0522000 [Daucus carota subsp. sativus]|uniref:Tumor necrosis factor receptor superfamily member 21 n=2 Tax=Daucus carota subsp. sativus TaxID=79200 RepID=A0AAF0XA79_DAUCS|nr:hypothetical protein DCAR_0522000 [Daucus carota subsp. sativus]
MWLREGVGGLKTQLVRHFSRKCAPNLRKINPRVPPQEANSIAEGLYQVIKDHGPLTVPNTWNQVKESGISGLSSKTHMKLMLKWMRGRKMLKLLCNQVGSNKKFLHCTLPEDPENIQSNTITDPKIQRKKKPSVRKLKVTKKNR